MNSEIPKTVSESFVMPSEDAPAWFTKAEAARRLGVHERTIENYVHEGKVASRPQPRDGKKAMTVILADDIERLLAESNRGTILPPVEQQVAAVAKVAPEVAGALVAGIRDAVRSAVVPAPHKAFQSLDEAAASSGLPKRLLLRCIRDGRLPAERFAGVWWVKTNDVLRIQFRTLVSNPDDSEIDDEGFGKVRHA